VLQKIPHLYPHNSNYWNVHESKETGIHNSAFQIKITNRLENEHYTLKALETVVAECPLESTLVLVPLLYEKKTFPSLLYKIKSRSWQKTLLLANTM